MHYISSFCKQLHLLFQKAVMPGFFKLFYLGIKVGMHVCVCVFVCVCVCVRVCVPNHEAINNKSDYIYTITFKRSHAVAKHHC